MKTNRTGRGVVALATLLALAMSGCGTREDVADIAAAHNGTINGAPVVADTTGGIVAGTDAGVPATGGTTGGVASGAADATAPGAGSATAPGTGGNAAGAPTQATPRAGTNAVGKSAGTASAGAGDLRPGQPITIGSAGTFSGIAGAAVGPGLKALQAWVSATNAAGGLKGHQIKLVSADDGGDPARHRQQVQQMVERDKVVAFVYQHAPLSGQATLQYLLDKRVPVMGDEGASGWFYQNPMFFPAFSTGAPYMNGIMEAAAVEVLPQGKKKLGIFVCQESQFCVDGQNIFPGVAAKLGFDVVYRGQGSLAQPDFTAQCLGARNAGVEVFAVMMDGNSVARVGEACERVGFHPIYVIHTAALLLSHTKLKSLDGLLIPTSTKGWFDTSVPSIARYQQALRQYLPGEQASHASFVGWVAGEMFAAAVKRTNDPNSSAGILAGLWALKGDDLGGITHKLNFTKDQNAPPVVCWTTVQLTNGQYNYTKAGKTLKCR